MTTSLLVTAYIAAAVLFILSLKGLAHPSTARRGNQFGAIGMLIAMVAVALHAGVITSPTLLGALAPAAALAIRAAQMSPLALGVNVGMLALSAALLAMMIRSFVVARRSRTAD